MNPDLTYKPSDIDSTTQLIYSDATVIGSLQKCLDKTNTWHLKCGVATCEFTATSEQDAKTVARPLVLAMHASNQRFVTVIDETFYVQLHALYDMANRTRTQEGFINAMAAILGEFFTEAMEAPDEQCRLAMKDFAGMVNEAYDKCRAIRAQKQAFMANMSEQIRQAFTGEADSEAPPAPPMH